MDKAEFVHFCEIAGLTSREAEILYFLLRSKDEKTIKDIAYSLDIPVSKCYVYVKSLYDKGLIQLIDSRPRTVKAKPIEEVVRRLIEIKKAEYETLKEKAEEIKKAIFGGEPSIEFITEIGSEPLHRRLVNILKSIKPKSTIITYTPKSIIWSIPDDMIYDPYIKEYRKVLWYKTTREGVEHKWIISLDLFIKRLKLGYVSVAETLRRLSYFRDTLRRLPLNVKFVNIPLQRTITSFSISVYGDEFVSIALKASGRRFNRGIIVRSRDVANYFKDILEFVFEKALIENIFEHLSMSKAEMILDKVRFYQELASMDEETKNKYLREYILYKVKALINKVKQEF